VYPFLIEDFYGLSITSFGLLVLTGALVGGQLAALSMERLGRSRDEAWSLVTSAVFGGLLGAKLWYVAEALARSPELELAAVLFSLGGLTWYGGLAGGALGVLISARTQGVPLAAACEAAAPAVAIGQLFGRLGCFMVGDDWGQPTDLPWGVAFPNGIEPTDVPVHPTMLYEAAWLALVTAWLWRRRGESPFLLGEYLMLAGLGRFAIEFWRRNPELVGQLSNAQITALSCFLAGALLWGWFLRRSPLPPPWQASR
jgi:phosphatidylglycerol:prolipoprotein diacylglycerol transferase